MSDERTTRDDTADRPARPAYGEYASPAELREILGPDHPLLQDATEAAAAPTSGGDAPSASTGPDAASATPSASTVPTSAPPTSAPGAYPPPTGAYGRPDADSSPQGTYPSQGGPAHPGYSAPAVAEKRPRPRWDLPITVGLLAYGLFNVVGAFTTRDQFPERFAQVFQMMGIGDFTAKAAAASAANWDAMLQLVVWVVVAILVALLARRLRVIFWIPLAGGALAGLISVVIGVIVMVQDPAYLELLNR
ncbi:DUF6264 family protein [Schumannella sp. 10F1B-5-1]|uniref:DUF6264 family protein n=1 Tax=Schumannella sp. 10F1B-5-1 TaxID=2590780 RepID=UPI0011329740|nr:DUF6264 family protein [Schumannella sp. 10F1B-5-1]TPW73084.1 hypothetical protein FJ658_07530 [Schumannella sp. 10F1B-5-1]